MKRGTVVDQVRWRPAIAFCCLLSATSASAEGSLPTPVRLASGVSGHVHPAFCLSKKGTLIVVFSQADFRDLRLTRSTDGGKTWSKPVAFAPAVKSSIYPGSLTTLSDGRILHAWNRWYPDGKTKSRQVVYSLSSDEGATWGPVRELPKNPKAQSVVRHAVLELGPSRWLFPLADRTVVHDADKGTELAFGDGRTHGLVPIVRTVKGTLVSGAGLRSVDAGKTWEKIAGFPAIASQGWRHDLTALNNGWLLATEVVGPGVGGHTWRFVVSRDDGRTWDRERPIDIYRPGRAIGGRACPKTVPLDRHTVGIVFYDVDAKQGGGPGLFFLRLSLKMP